MIEKIKPHLSTALIATALIVPLVMMVVDSTNKFGADEDERCYISTYIPPEFVKEPFAVKMVQEIMSDGYISHNDCQQLKEFSEDVVTRRSRARNSEYLKYMEQSK